MDYRYPIGTFEYEGEISSGQREIWIKEIEQLPAQLRATVQDLTEEQLDIPYRDGGWTIRQVVHHVSDSHMNAFTRFKLALTEDTPTIKPYLEDRWVSLGDSLEVDIDISLALLEALHKKWVILLTSLSESDYQKEFYHPESQQTVRLAYCLGTYAWHGNHHVAHITAVRDRLQF
ncbi:YfiT family bacillithiol transferase [Paenibacillus sp. 481]|uniref:YfiT family bacillithiol transferase n=1 Tax=Paenibacillus sp. 481 TaxID=2835869 RepID=UPI001E495E22|nr:putative metal-dependent hydrolase [Paenibacillus sp. 481]UHA71761.1 putative metal-dependent hydrolase [Paenibacillus sp. 481]